MALSKSENTKLLSIQRWKSDLVRNVCIRMLDGAFNALDTA